MNEENGSANPQPFPASPVPATDYENIPLDDLVLFAAKRILDSGEECTVERLVSECFTLFPKSFCLPRYPQWPDSARVNKSWWRCRTDKGWLVGSVKEGLRLTPAGERAVEVVSRKLGLKRPLQQGKKPRERHEALLQKIRNSDLFRRFQRAPELSEVQEGELRSLLEATLETPVRVLKQNWRFFFEVAQTYDDKEVMTFLLRCRDFLPNRTPKR